METLEYNTYDKTEWGDGPWMEEPDKVQFQDEATGLPCLIVRNHFGNLCGYVGVGENHCYFGKGYDEIDYEVVEVHGGLTFAAFCQPGPESQAICHIPGQGESDNIWWFGFDAGHA
jgi:hypothetical protein